jgi:hypothetical protein
MSKVNLMKREGYSIGDVAVDGLLNGVIAGVAMAIYMLLMLLHWYIWLFRAFTVLFLDWLLLISPGVGVVLH